MSSAATNILHQPTYTTLSIRFSNLQSSNPSLFLAFSTKKPVLCGRLVSRTMTEMVKTSSFRNSRNSIDVEEDVRVLEQEALIDGSSQVAAARLESTLNRLSKWIVAASFGGVIIWRHDAEALWALMGSVVNAILSVTLKRILNQERPVSTSRSDPGMPSSHAQSIFFIVTYIILSVEEALGLSGATFAISGLAMACGSYLVIMAKSLSTTSYNQSSGRGRCSGIYFLHFVVIGMACFCAGSVSFQFMGTTAPKALGNHHSAAQQNAGLFRLFSQTILAKKVGRLSSVGGNKHCSDY
ncbi:hypothetical protein Patl1_28971 [Pistacia atlantica]|uniref:Uncharacterized protein n=1 Tax=Pistacia atlantica TaxID=434234 RepID=A0ACC1BE04_9ROSI|nr:hypothetical protein Patl1_28971 [Pistacia atlantica]